MAYHGLEVTFIDVRAGDSILVTRWERGEPTRVLIDGGKANKANKVAEFLEDHDVDHIDHVVASHSDHDHAGGLVPLLDEEVFTLDHGWMHIPERHADTQAIRKALAETSDLTLSGRIVASLDDANKLLEAFQNRGIEPDEPFQGQSVGPLTCIGPSEDFYEELLDQFRDRDKLKSLDQRLEKVRAGETMLAQVQGKAEEWPDQPETSAENNTSTIMEVSWEDDRVLLTADAGVAALEHADGYRSLAGVHMVQACHHGSRFNLTDEWIEKFGASYAYISAPGKNGHPAQCVVRAFQKRGAPVYSTHYPPSRRAKRKSYGEVPEDGWKEGIPLDDPWESDD